jgi:hypothetical protein
MTNRGVAVAVISSEKWRMTHASIPAGLTISTGTGKKKNPTGYNSGIWQLLSIVFEPISTQILK